MSVNYFLLLILPALAGFLNGHPGDVPGNAAAVPVENDCSIQNDAFRPGEEVVYKIYYQLSPLWVSAGEVSFRVEDAGDAYRFRVVGFTYKSLEWFYKGLYTFESQVDKESLLPRQFIRTIQERKFSHYYKFIFDQNTGVVKTWEGKTVDESEQKTMEIGKCMHDMISVLYYMRNLDFDQLNVGSSLPVEIFLEERYPLNVHVLAKNEEKRIRGLGKKRTHVFSPEVIAGEVFNEKTQMTIWVSADQNKIPLMIESPVRIGRVKAILHSYKGLRHEFIADE
jgi:hypothetical protein